MDNKNTYEDALKSIAAPKFGLQEIIEDYGHDQSEYDYHAMIYYRDLANRYEKIALEALLK